jgi:hypothetical protein
MKKNYERVAHKITQNEEEGKKPGFAHVCDLIRASARYDNPSDMIEAIRGITTAHRVVKFANKLLGDLRNLTMVIEVDSMLAEI